jgi:hypothetical protein
MRAKIIRAPHLVQGCGLGSIVAINELDLSVAGIMPLSLEAGALLSSQSLKIAKGGPLIRQFAPIVAQDTGQYCSLRAKKLSEANRWF